MILKLSNLIKKNNLNLNQEILCQIATHICESMSLHLNHSLISEKQPIKHFISFCKFYLGFLNMYAKWFPHICCMNSVLEKILSVFHFIGSMYLSDRFQQSPDASSLTSPLNSILSCLLQHNELEMQDKMRLVTLLMNLPFKDASKALLLSFIQRNFEIFDETNQFDILNQGFLRIYFIENVDSCDFKLFTDQMNQMNTITTECDKSLFKNQLYINFGVFIQTLFPKSWNIVQQELILSLLKVKKQSSVTFILDLYCILYPYLTRVSSLNVTTECISSLLSKISLHSLCSRRLVSLIQRLRECEPRSIHFSFIQDWNTLLDQKELHSDDIYNALQRWTLPFTQTENVSLLEKHLQVCFILWFEFYFHFIVI